MAKVALIGCRHSKKEAGLGLLRDLHSTVSVQ